MFALIKLGSKMLVSTSYEDMHWIKISYEKKSYFETIFNDITYTMYIKQFRLTRLYILTITTYNIGQYRINNSWIAISQFALYKSAVDGIIHQKYARKTI